MAMYGTVEGRIVEDDQRIEIKQKGVEDMIEEDATYEEGRWSLNRVMSFIDQSKTPFSNPDILGMEIFGAVLMFVLILVSNMGGLSGAGSNIPIMLICNDMNMNEAVPLSAAVAVCATFFRFILNFKQKHPNAKDRVAINYEVVEITMPFVFLGSFTGVKLGQFFPEWVRVLVFGITVAWSIKTTAAKAMSLRAKEKAAAEKAALLGDENQQNTTVQNAASVTNDTEIDK